MGLCLGIDVINLMILLNMSHFSANVAVCLLQVLLTGSSTFD